jgi:predicted acetyltransferase
VTIRLRLRPPGFDDEAAFVAAHAAMANEGFKFGIGYEPGCSWSGYLRRLDGQRRGTCVPDGHVPMTFLVADVAGCLIGRTSIRHELNDRLRCEGGHIGYGVLREHRRRGYATEMLRQSLVVARAVGVGRVLVTCDDDNLASAAVIERCGGTFESLIAAHDGHPVRRYWID